MRELKVVPGSLGREREFIDVSRDKKRGRGAGRPVSEEAAKNLSGKELLQAATADRTYIPVRGKKKKPTKKGAEDADHRARRAQEGHPHRGVDLASPSCRRRWA